MLLLITLIAGLFTLFGALIVLLSKNNKQIINYSISIGFGVLISLIFLELIPEILEIFLNETTVLKAVAIVLLLMFGGIFLLKVLDKFIPDHDMNSSDNLFHMGVMTSVALFIHNFIEGMAIYTALKSSFNLGLLVAFAVALHNIPLGMTICSFFYKKMSKKKTILICLLVSVATFVGALLINVFSASLINELTLGILLALTLGMLVYITIYELLPQIISTKNKKETIIGVSIGVIILVISILLE